MDNQNPQVPSQPVQQIQTNPIPQTVQPAPIIANTPPNDNKTLITVLLLIFFFPLGFILMWFWTKWPKWVKIVISLPTILIILGVISSIILIALNPASQLEKAECVKQCQAAGSSEECLLSCNEDFEPK